MKDITDELDIQIQTNLSCPQFKFWGLAELITKGTQAHPVTVDLLGNPKRSQIAIDDKFDGIVYHRVLSGGSLPSEESFGSEIALEYAVKLRTVLSYKVSKLPEEFAYDFANAIPDTLSLTGYKYIDASENVTLIVDQEAIYKTEFGGGDYEKHITPWNIVAIEHDIQFVKC